VTVAERIFRVADNRNPASLASRLRAKRFQKFAELLVGASEPVRILDVGGTPEFWIRHVQDLPVRVEVTLLNREFERRPEVAGVSYVQGDARSMDMFGDFEFDMCFSNSVIEHVGEVKDQMRMASEILRVARGYFVQTPNKYFPIEPHFLFVGWQFMPLSTRAWLLQRRGWGWMKREPSAADALTSVASIRLLTVANLRELFPDGSLHREWFGLMVKSISTFRLIGPK
jgi:hypothetical protein